LAFWITVPLVVIFVTDEFCSAEVGPVLVSPGRFPTIGMGVSAVFGATQDAVVPLLDPAQDQVQFVPESVIDDAVPALQRLMVGAVAELTP